MSAIKEVEIKLGDVVMAVWPYDPSKKVRPFVVVAARHDQHGSLYRLVLRTTKRVDRFRVHPADVFVSKEQSAKLGLDGEGRFDTSRQCVLAHVIEVKGNIAAVPGLKEALVAARNSFKRS